MMTKRDKEIFWFETDTSNRSKIAARYDDVSLDQWVLSVRTRNALKRHNANITIGDVIRADDSFSTIRSLGQKSFRELHAKVSEILDGITENINFDDEHSKLDVPPEVDDIASIEDAFVSQTAHTILIEQLHLKTRTYNALKKSGVNTSAALFQAKNLGFSGIPRLGSNSTAEINQVLSALLSSLTEENEVDWLRYYRIREIELLPADFETVVTTEEILTKLPRIIREILLSDFDERTWIIIQRRFGLENTEKLVLEELGEAFGLTRERVRQIEERAKKTLKEVLCEDKYVNKKYRMRSAVQTTINALSQLVPTEKNELVLETDLLEQVREIFGINPATIFPSLFLVFSLGAAERIEFDAVWLVPVWGIVNAKQRRKLEMVVKRIDDFLTRETSLPKKDFDILRFINIGLKKTQKITLTELRRYIELCSSIERRDDGLVWGKFEYLKGRGHQVERLLTEVGKPMSLTRMARTINHRLIPLGERKADARNVGNQISNDERFVPIGRSGEWGLRAWEYINPSTIVELMEECLITLNRPATADEIYTYVSERRSVSEKSIIAYLANEDNFAKVDRANWGLAHWKEARNAKTWNPEEVADFVAGLFKKKRAKELEYKNVKQSLMDAANVSDRQARGLLNVNPVITTRREKTTGKIYAIFQLDYKDKLERVGARFERKKRTLRQQIDETVRNILEAAPAKQVLLPELIAELQKQYDYPKQTLYQYVGQLAYLEKIDFPEARTKICRIKGPQEELSFPQVQDLANPDLKKKIERAILFLTEEDVDIGLFLLSKEFEAALKTYLIKANSRKKLVSLPQGKTPDRWKLAGMVDCAKNNGIITDHAVLHFLRQERNNRAHGSMPSIEERRILMASAQYIAGMYIDYIKLLDDLHQTL